MGFFKAFCCHPTDSYKPIPQGTEVVSISGEDTGKSGIVAKGFDFQPYSENPFVDYGCFGYVVNFKGVGEKIAHWGTIVPVLKSGDEKEDFDISTLDETTKIEEADHMLV